MRIEPIEPSAYVPFPALPPLDRSLNRAKEEKAEEQEASKEVPSVWYSSTLQSLKEATEVIDPKKSDTALSAVEGLKEEKSFIRKLQDWLWGMLGWGKTEETQEANGEKAALLDSKPKLDPPEMQRQSRMKEALLEFNRSLARRMKEIAEFEEEMRRSNSNKLDKLIFLNFVSSSLKQKEINDASSLFSSEEILRNFNRNKALNKTYFSLAEEVASLQKTNKVLNWVSAGGVAVGVAGTIALTVATGGLATLLQIAIPLGTLVGGGSKLTGAIMSHKADLKEGERFIITQETKRNSSKNRAENSAIRGIDEGNAQLFSTLRQQLEEQSRAERASFSR